jgi:tetratricopeptide (TPR) repeat protein
MPSPRLPLLAALLALASALPARADAPFVQLTTRPTPHLYAGQGSLLAREIARQAVLLAARNELSAPTRDASLSEPFDQHGTLIDLQFTIQIDRRLNLALAHPDDASPAWHTAIPITPRPNVNFDYLAQTTTLEALSRNEFVDTLKKLGVTGDPFPWHPDDPAPRDLQPLLDAWNLLDNFAFVRQLQADIRAHGESRERLAQLARAYAQMGASARILSGPEYAVFSARALLYAQRLAVKDNNSPLALWTRAFVRAVAGFQGAALEDIAAAKAAAKPDAPPWAGLLEQYCRYQTDDLLATAEERGPLAALAAQFAFMSAENIPVNAYRMKVADQVIHLNLPCDLLAVSEFACDHSGPGLLNTLVEFGPTVMAVRLPAFAHDVKLPDAAAKTAAAVDKENVLPAETKMAEQLIATADGDNADPSWAALGHLLQGITFTHVWRRTDLIKNNWGVSADDYVQEALPYIKHHPLAPIVAAAGEAGDAALKPFMEKQLETADLSPATLNQQRSLHSPYYHQFFTRWSENMDYTTFELEKRLDPGIWPDPDPRIVHQLFVSSPFSPVAIAARIQTNWKASEAARTSWEPALGKHPLIARAMVLHFVKENDPVQAAAWARIWVDGSPDLPAYSALADALWQQGKEDQWKATLDEFLVKGYAFGLERTRARVMIADYLRAKGDYQAAWKYAKVAAQSGAAWASMCAARCAEYIGDWDSAEAYFAEESQHYVEDIDRWYLWCHKTGKGDLDAARKALEQTPSFWKNPDNIASFVAYQIFEGHPDKAVDLLQKNLAHTRDPWSGLHLALIYDADGKTAERDRALAATADLGPRFPRGFAARPQMVKLAALFQASLKPGVAKLTPDAIDPILKTAPAEASNLAYFAGRFVELHGDKENAKRYYAQALWSTNQRFVNMSLSGARLQALGTDPTTLKPPAVPTPTTLPEE